MMSLSTTWTILIQLLSYLSNFDDCFTSAYEPQSYGPQPEIDRCYSGKRQSPIHIREENAVDRPETNITFVNLDQYVYHIQQFKAVRADKTVTVYSDPGQMLHVILYHGLRYTAYIFHSLHFHWGCSEHSLSLEDYFSLKGFRSWRVEIHFVYYNQAFRTYDRAMREPDGIFVYAVLFRSYPEVTTELGPLKLFMDYLENPGKPDRSEDAVQWFDFLFYNRTRRDTMYYYEGSATRYPCMETVIWGVNRKWKPVTPEQIRYFRESFYNYNVSNEYDSKPDLPKRVPFNCRPQQPARGRTVYKVKYEVKEGIHPIPPIQPDPRRYYRPGEGEFGELLPPNWLIYLVPAFILGGLTYMHRHYDWSFLDELREDVNDDM